MYTHNLSISSDIQSCFDPVSGIGDGTTVGNAFYLRQVFGGLTAFDSNVREITSSTATPSWLRPLSGNILSTIAVNNASNGFIRFYFENDPGLTASTSSISANCIIYHWEFNTGLGTTNEPFFTSYVLFSLSGTSYISTSVTSNNTNSFNYDLNRNNQNQTFLRHIFSGTSNTTMSNFPKILYWKSYDILMMMGVDKNDSSLQGGGAIYVRPHWQGFASSASATSTSGTIINGQNFNLICQINNSNGGLILEGFNRFTSEENDVYASIDGWTNISSAGKLPTLGFSVSGVVKVITSSLRMGVQPTTNPQFIATSSEIDNVLLVNSSLYTGGSMQLLNGIYYLVNGLVTDGKNTYNLLLQLSG